MPNSPEEEQRDRDRKDNEFREYRRISDHDLLVRIETKLDIYTIEWKTGQKDHETRIRRLEQISIVAGLLNLVAGAIIWYLRTAHP